MAVYGSRHTFLFWTEYTNILIMAETNKEVSENKQSKKNLELQYPFSF
jgi:hypothetical protein